MKILLMFTEKNQNIKKLSILKYLPDQTFTGIIVTSKHLILPDISWQTHFFQYHKKERNKQFLSTKKFTTVQL